MMDNKAVRFRFISAKDILNSFFSEEAEPRMIDELPEGSIPVLVKENILDDTVTIYYRGNELGTSRMIHGKFDVMSYLSIGDYILSNDQTSASRMLSNDGLKDVVPNADDKKCLYVIDNNGKLLYTDSESKAIAGEYDPRNTYVYSCYGDTENGKVCMFRHIPSGMSLPIYAGNKETAGKILPLLGKAFAEVWVDLIQ